MKKPTILIIDNSTDITGALKAIVNATFLLKEDFNFLFVIPNRDKVAEYVEHYDLNVARFNMIEINKKWQDILLYIPYLFKNAWKLSRLIKAKNISIVHVNDYYNMMAIIPKLFLKISMVTHVRRLPKSLPKILSFIWLYLDNKFSKKMICVSNATYDQIHCNKAMVIYDYICLEEKYDQKTGDQNSNVKLLYLANYIPGKGQDMALEAFNMAYKKNKMLKLKFVGSDMSLNKNKKFKEDLINFTKKHSLSNVVSFNDFNFDIEKEIKEADIVLNFSESESFSMTCLEALRFGTPVIATDCGGPTEIVVDQYSGIIVPNRNIDQMCNAILKLSNDGNMRSTFGKFGKKDTSIKFSKDNTVELLRKVYQDILTT